MALVAPHQGRAIAEINRSRAEHCHILVFCKIRILLALVGEDYIVAAKVTGFAGVPELRTSPLVIRLMLLTDTKITFGILLVVLYSKHV